MDNTDVVVIGAGVIGLAISRAFAMAGKEVVILERESHPGTGVSARNSGVIHAGIYYPSGSRKAQWCVRGRHLLYEYASRRHVAHRRVQKLIVASSAQAGALEQLYDTGRANGVEDLQLISGRAASALEPSLRCDLALHSPSTGIMDVHDLMQALLGDAQQHGALLAVQSRFHSAAPDGGGWRIRVGTAVDPGSVPDVEMTCDVLINAAGLDAIAVAQSIEGLDANIIPPMHFAKGNYARLNGRCPFMRLIYPVPVPGGLGTHLTINMGGQAQLGPDVEWLPSPTAQQLAHGLAHAYSFDVDPARLQHFAADVRRWWPDLPEGALSPGYSGIRPKLVGPGQPAADFLVQGPRDHGLPGLFQFMGMESPGLTSCLAIAEEALDMAL